MALILHDIDFLVVSMIDLKNLTGLVSVNKYFLKLVEKQSIYMQWKYIRFRKFYATYHINVSTLELCTIEYKYDISIKQMKHNVHSEFYYACTLGFLEYSKYLMENKLTVLAEHKVLFRSCCKKGQLDVVKWFYEIAKNDFPLDVHWCDDWILKNSPPHVVEWLNILEGPLN